MELQYFGANCVRIMTKKANIVFDDNLDEVGAKSVTKPEDIKLSTTPIKSGTDASLLFDKPGEYEVSDVAITGIAARAHMDEEGKQSATMFRVQVDDLRILVTGHIYPELNDEQLEAIGIIDVMVVPVGGHGYTLDGVGALKVIKKVEPKLVVPTHFADGKLMYEVPQADLADALKDLGMEITDTVPKLKIKSADLPESMQLVVLERQ